VVIGQQARLQGLLKLFLNPPTTNLNRFVSTYATADVDSIGKSQLTANFGDGSVDKCAMEWIILPRLEVESPCRSTSLGLFRQRLAAWAAFPREEWKNASPGALSI
jgi:hypothetical protein